MSILSEQWPIIILAAILIVGGFLPVIFYRWGQSTSRDTTVDLRSRLNQALEDLSKRLAEIGALTTKNAEQARAIADLTTELMTYKNQRRDWSSAGLIVDEQVMRQVMSGGHWSRAADDDAQRFITERSTIPILAVGNLKGGVGKTTLAANLGAYFGATGGGDRSVLFLDFDFQGSLSTILNAISDAPPETGVVQIFDDRKTAGERLLTAKRLAADGMNAGCAYYDADFDVASVEDQMLFRWLSDELQNGKENGAPIADLRLALKRFLLSDAVQSRFDMVVIDMPPRNTTFAINALCAATHLLIPTKVDDMSINAVYRFLVETDELRETLFPHLQVAGVVPTMTPASKKWETRFEHHREAWNAEWRGAPSQIPLLKPIPEREAIARSSSFKLAVLEDEEVKSIFSGLAAEVSSTFESYPGFKKAA